MRSRFGSEEKKGKGEGEIAMVRRGKDAMKESPRENKYEPAWMPKLIKEGKDREISIHPEGNLGGACQCSISKKKIIVVIIKGKIGFNH